MGFYFILKPNSFLMSVSSPKNIVYILKELVHVDFFLICPKHYRNVVNFISLSDDKR